MAASNLAAVIPQVMGVVNVTPDSFSNGGRFLDPDAAVAHGLELAGAGAAIIDVGGESTRPGAEPVAPEEELRRVLPVVEGLHRHLPGQVRISVDTRSAVVAEAAVGAGASIINDMSASLWSVAADRGAGWIAGHLRGEPRTMQEQVSFTDVVAEVRDELLAAIEPARAAGLEEIWIDPGIGFGKTAEHNLQLLRHLRALVGTGFPVVVGTSRKSFLGRLVSPEDQPPAPTDDRLEGSLATAVWAVAEGAAVVRAHDVAPTVQAVRIVTQPVEASR
jgi:dihydropteroate synthase